MKTRKNNKGVSIVELMIAVAVISVAVFGGVSYRLSAALSYKKAIYNNIAARVALTLCESWSGTIGSTAYDPVAHLNSDDMSVSSDSGPATPSGFSSIGAYMVIVDETPCYANLSYKDIDSSLRALNVTVAWAQRDKQTSTLGDMDKRYELTTYVNR